MRWLDGAIDTVDTNLSQLWEMLRDGDAGLLPSVELQRAGHAQ